VFLARRVVVGVVAAVLVVLLAQVAGVVLVSGAAVLSGTPAASGEVYDVRPGDTLWSIAGDLAPQMDPRVAVDELSALNGGASLDVGDRLQLPASFG
jgi:Tfp pilus assembly protein FimV